MENNTKLTELVEQAACCVNMLSPSDLSDGQTLQKILDQIGEAAGRLDQGPVDLRRQLEGTTAETTKTLQRILEQEAEDTAEALATVSKAICVLQDLIGRLAAPHLRPAPAAVPVAPAPAQALPPRRRH